MPDKDRTSRPFWKALSAQYIGFMAAFQLLLWIPVFYEFQKRVGISGAKILEIQSIYYLSFCFLEIPTGLFADLFGRRLSVRVGAICFFLSNIAPGILVDGVIRNWGTDPTVSYAWMLTHFLLTASARSFISGAFSAYFFEHLKKEGAVSEYAAMEARARVAGLASRVFGWAGIGFLMNFHLSLPYWLTALGGVVALYFAFRLPPDVPGTLDAGPEKALASVVARIRDAIQDIREAPLLRIALVLGVPIFVLDRVVFVNLFQPILTSKGIDWKLAGTVLAVTACTEAIGAFQVKRIARLFAGRVRAYEWVLFLTLIESTFYGCLPLAGKTGTWVLLGLATLVGGVAMPFQKQAVNEAVLRPRVRATLISLESLLERSVSAAAAWWLSRIFMQSGEAQGVPIFLMACAVGAWVWTAFLVGMRSLALRPRRASR
ncbi:MAG: MFS transporter [Bdellovibrionales bacterium]|nr:MFS transporter [Bdellovibrionales bacterium]